MTQQSGCIFCRIVAGEIPGDIVYRDAEIAAFRDIHPLAPIHILIVPTQHIASLNEVPEGQQSLLGRLVFVARRLAEKEKAASGYRVVINTGREGGQVVPHLHLHLLAGRRLDDELG